MFYKISKFFNRIVNPIISNVQDKCKDHLIIQPQTQQPPHHDQYQQQQQSSQQLQNHQQKPSSISSIRRTCSRSHSQHSQGAPGTSSNTSIGAPSPSFASSASSACTTGTGTCTEPRHHPSSYTTASQGCCADCAAWSSNGKQLSRWRLLWDTSQCNRITFYSQHIQIHTIEFTSGDLETWRNHNLKIHRWQFDCFS